MDRTLEDSLNMESIESMDFDHSAVVVNQADICLEDNQDPNISMDIDIIEEQPPLLESGQEEVIVSDFMGEQFSFQDYTMPEDNSNANITIDANQINNLLVQNPTTPAPQHNIVKIKALPQQRVPKKIAPAAFPRQVAIAPKPVKGAVNVQFAIAPKPVAVVVNKNNMTKSIPMKNIVQGSLKGNTVLTQIGKQLVMVPSSAVGQKFKLTSLLQPSGSSESTIDLSQMMSNKLTNKPVQAKIIMQGSNVAESSEPSNSGGVLTKLVPVSGAHGHATYVMQQKTIPITIAQKKLLMTPPKTAKIVQKKQVINIKPQSPATQENVTTKKVVITANPSQSVVIRPINKTGTAQTMTKQNVIQTQHGQLHPINVPGKGIQFIKLLSSQPSKTGSLVPSNYVLADSKGNIIQLSDKVLNTSQSSLLVSAAPALTTTDKGAPKTKRLVRIAPVAAQTVAPTAVTPARPTQSLLAPTESSPATVSLEQLSQIMSGASMPSLTEPDNTQELADHDIHTDIIKQSLSSISECGAEEETLADQHIDMHEVEIQCENTPVKREPYMEESSNSMDQSVGNSDQPEPNVIIVPASFEPSDRHQSYTEDSNISNGEDMHEMNVQTEILRLLSPKGSQSYLESSLDMEPRPGSAEGRSRKPCNCTKSQCLKLYCDCFASGEFCNGCNCNNCLNNLDHEEKRQRAIRSCLDRNPNAFRPKIGKGKTAGPEIIRRHNKGCNCKRSGCLKNYCECYEAKIACTAMCKCVGCRNVQETLQRRRAARARDAADTPYRPPAPTTPVKHACHMVTQEVIESVAHCLLAVVDETHDDPVHDVLLEFSRCVQDIITHAHNHSCCL